jgi:hypothetical protein
MTDWRTMRQGVGAYLIFVLAVNLLICFWIGGNDYDSFAFHLVRIKLEQFGPLSETATTQIQQVFPKFFDYLHGPFLEIGYFKSLPTFALVIAVVWLIYRFEELRVAGIALVLLFSAQAFVANISTLKNDLGLALIAFLCWFAIYRIDHRDFYVPIVTLLLCALVGTKWHGFIVAGPLGACFLYETVRRRLFSPTAAVITLAALPVYVIASSLPVYAVNVLDYGTPFPRNALNQYDPGFRTLLRNTFTIVGLSVIDTFTIPIYYLDNFLHGRLFTKIDQLFPGGKLQGFAIMPSTIINVWGYVLPLQFGACVLVALRRDFDRSLRTAAGIALLFFVVVEWQSINNDLFNRYLLTTFVLGLLPTAHLIARFRLPHAAAYLAIGYMVIVSAHAMLMHHERPLVPLRVFYPKSPVSIQEWPSIWTNIRDRELLQFGMWSGYRMAFIEFRNRVKISDGLTIINGGDDVRVPFLYPFIARREPANTRIVNLRGKAAPPVRTHFILTFAYKLTDPLYRDISAPLNQSELGLYERIDPDPPAGR